MPSRDICSQTRKLSEITPKFGLFCPPKSFKKGGAPLKVVLALSPQPEARQVAKYRKATLTTPKVIGAHLLKIEPILDPL